MIEAQLPSHESERLASLVACRILDTEPERAFDDLTALAARWLDAPMAFVSLVDADRQWFKSRVGVDAHETPRSIAFCSHAILEPRRTMLVPDAALDPRFVDSPLVTSAPFIRAYAGVPILDAEGRALGAFCAADTRPRAWDTEHVSLLEVLARQVSSAIELRRTYIELAAVLEENSDLRKRIAATQELQRPIAEIEAEFSTCTSRDETVVACLGWLREAYPDLRCSYGLSCVDTLDVVLSLQPEGMPATSLTSGYSKQAFGLQEALASQGRANIADITRDPRAQGLDAKRVAAGARSLLAFASKGPMTPRFALLLESARARHWSTHDQELLAGVVDALERAFVRFHTQDPSSPSGLTSLPGFAR